MDAIQKQVRRAQWRLALQRFVGVLGWCWFVTLLLALVLIVAGKLRWLEVEPWIWGAGALGLGLVAAGVWVTFARQSAIDAAIEIDHRFGLKERVSSAVALSPEERDSEAGRALIEDALRRADRIDVDERFRVRPGRPLLLPLLPALTALLVAVLVSPAAVENPAEAGDPAAVETAVKKAGAALAQKLEEQRKEAEKRDLKDAEQLFKKLEQGTKDLAEKSQGDRKKALVELNDLAKELEKQREKLGGADQVKNQLRQLKNLNEEGPADKMAKAISRGDFQEAMKELEKLKQDVAGGQLNEKQKAELARQMEEMKDKLEKLAQAQQAAQKDLKEQLDKARKAGNAAEAAKLEEQLDKLAQNAPQMDKVKDLAEKLGQCSKCMKDGNLKDAAGKLQQIQADLKDLDQQLAEMQMVDQAMDQLGQMRDQMNCPKCQGAGCAECQGDQPGDGMGRGRGKGFRPEQKTDTATYDSHAPQKIGRGSATIVDLVDGPNLRGKSQREIQAEIQAAEQAQSDPLSSQRMPRKHRQEVQDYFDQFHKDR
jgi:chemotaxis protein histidine kinase CheA